MRARKLVVAALVRDGTRVLMSRRRADQPMPGLWEFPGGKVEPGETEEAALIRECVEELAVELNVGRKLWSTSHDYDDVTVKLELFAATIRSGAPKPLGAQALKFCTPREMQALPFCEADLPLLEQFVSGAVPVR